MYPNIAPDLKLEQTISNPEDPAEVYGFIGRNKKLGRTAVVLKGDVVVEETDGQYVEVPSGPFEELDQNDSELVLLGDVTVKAMTGADFALEAEDVVHQGGGDTHWTFRVPRSSENFRSFDRSEVQVGN